MKIYALLVAINEYNEIQRLAGCISDVENIETYLNQIHMRFFAREIYNIQQADNRTIL